MKGKILDYDKNTDSGVISGEDGNRYTFSSSEWKSANEPTIGRNVDFQTGDNAEATGIFADISSSQSSKKIAASLLALFLGYLGIHKFYLGYKKEGFIMLLVFIFGFILLGFPSAIIGIIAFVEFILYIIKSDDEFEQTYVTGKKGWF